MARDYARLQTRIWIDRDFRKLTRGAQHMYFTLISQPTLSYCGVMDWWPNRLAELAADTSEDHVNDDVQHLIDRRYIELDPYTAELLIRSYIRHDHILTRTNMGKACGRAMENIASLNLHDAVLRELARLHNEDRTLPGLLGIKDLYPAEYQTITSMAAAMP